MEEDMKTAQTVEAPEAPETQETVEEPKDAVKEVADAPSTSEVDAEKKDAGAEEQAGTPDPKEDNDKRSMAEKIKALENEKNEYLQAKKMLEALDSAAANDPEFMKLANKKLVEQGLLDESVLEKLDQAPAQQKADVGAKDPAVLWAEQKMREEHEKREKFFNDFEERHPDLTEGKPEVIKANRSAIGAAAAKRMAEGGVSEQDAFEFAYKLIMNPSQLVEEGKLQGIAQAQSATPTEGAASGGSAKSSGTVELTPEQKEAASLFGISEEAYAKNVEE
jgi:hypothetical protein